MQIIYELTVKEENAPDNAAWKEELTADVEHWLPNLTDVELNKAVEEEAKSIVKWFNDTCRPPEKKREYVASRFLRFIQDEEE